MTPLHYAAQYCSREFIDVLLDAGARVNELCADGRTALHWAVCNSCCGEMIARKLILAGININVIDGFGMTALEVARNDERHGIIEVIGKAVIKVIGKAPAQRSQYHQKIEGPMGEYVFAIE